MQLLVDLAERLSIIVTIALLMTRSRKFRLFLHARLTQGETITLILIFGAFATAGTYFGIPIQGAFANSRAVGAVSAGLLGGPLIGLGAGLIAGLHRYLVFGGFTGFACALSTTVEGLIGGLVFKYWRERSKSWLTGTLVGMGAEVCQMVIILIFSRPFNDAWQLVKTIAFPMIFVNGLGVGLFLIIIKTIFAEEERIAAVQAQKVLRIADLTLPFLRQGLTRDSAQRAAQTIYDITGVDAVALTDGDQVLAHVGIGADHHHEGLPIMTKATRKALATGMSVQAASEAEIDCIVPGCPLRSAVVVPLRQGGNIVGTLKIYRSQRGKSPLDLELAEGLGKLFSTQLELAEVEQQKELRASAEIRALQAQIHPHFLFNALNTVVSLIRTHPENAREVLIFLGEFLRCNLRQGAAYHSVREEIEHVQAYLAVEMARFGSKLKVEINAEPSTEAVLLPPLVLQPLVENAVRHGILPKETGGTVRLDVQREQDHLQICVSDDGVGMSAFKLRRILDFSDSGSGVGLKNVHQRLIGLYGHGLDIDSMAGHGTRVRFALPLGMPRSKEVAS